MALGGVIFIATINMAPDTGHGQSFMDRINVAIRQYVLLMGILATSLCALHSGEANRTMELNSSSLEKSGYRNQTQPRPIDDCTEESEDDSQSGKWTTGNASFIVGNMPGPSSEATCRSYMSDTSISLSAAGIRIKPEKAIEIAQLCSHWNRDGIEAESENDQIN